MSVMAVVVVACQDCIDLEVGVSLYRWVHQRQGVAYCGEKSHQMNEHGVKKEMIIPRKEGRNKEEIIMNH